MKIFILLKELDLEQNLKKEGLRILFLMQMVGIVQKFLVKKPIVSLVQMNLSLVQKTKCLLSMIQNSISLL